MRDDAAVFGFVRRPAVLVGDLATALGVAMADLLPNGRYGMGSILVTSRLSAAVDGVSANYA